MATGIDKAQEARIELARILAKLGFTGEVLYPDIATKAKVQALIGLNMAKLRAEKQVFLKTTIPQWDKEAKEREAKYP